MPFPRVLPAAEADIEAVLLKTLRKFGEWKYRDYAALIEEALEELERNPKAGRPRPEIHPEAWIYLIGKRGRRAAHLFLYRIVNDEQAEIRAFLHGAMHLPRQWRKREP